MPHPRDHHHHPVFFRESDGVVVADGATGLDHSVDPFLMRDAYTIIEGEEGIGSHHSTFQIEIELTGLFNSVTEGINAGSLAATFTYQLLILHQCDRIRFEVFTNDIRKGKI